MLYKRTGACVKPFLALSLFYPLWADLDSLYERVHAGSGQTKISLEKLKRDICKGVFCEGKVS